MSAPELTVSGPCATITFRAGSGGIPFLDPPSLRRLDALLERLEREGSVERVVLASEGQGYFLASQPPERFEALGERAVAVEYAELGGRVLTRLAALEPLTVAAIGGRCIGAGLELILACDARIAASDRELLIGSTEVLLGLVPPWGALLRLTRLVGPTFALAMISRNLALDAEHARAWGLVEEVVPAEVLVDAARRLQPSRRRWRLMDRLVASLPLLRRIVLSRAARAGGAGAEARVARLVELALTWPEDEVLRLEREAFVECAVSDEAHARRQALLASGVVAHDR